MKRREFITLLGGAAVAWPLAVRAQLDDMRRIGVLIGPAESDAEAQSEIAAFRRSLQNLGLTGGKVRIAYRWAAGDAARMRTFASELMAFQPHAAVAVTTPALRALVGESRTLPIVFTRVSNPVEDGFVNSLAKPGGNVTGFSNIGTSLFEKWVQLLKEFVPGLARATVMFNPATAPGGGLNFLRLTEVAASSIGIEVSAARVHDAAGIGPAIAAVGREANVGLIIGPDVFLGVHRQLIIEQAARYRVPTIYQYRYFAASGGLISYGADVLDQYNRAAEYIDRILKGAKPADLPVQQPTKFELVINFKTAKALGLAVPNSLLVSADEVIE